MRIALITLVLLLTIYAPIELSLRTLQYHRFVLANEYMAELVVIWIAHSIGMCIVIGRLK